MPGWVECSTAAAAKASTAVRAAPTTNNMSKQHVITVVGGGYNIEESTTYTRGLLTLSDSSQTYWRAYVMESQEFHFDEGWAWPVGRKIEAGLEASSSSAVVGTVWVHGYTI